MVPLMRLRYFRILAGAGLAIWMGLYPADWQQWLGFSKAAYFTEGQNYAFASGVGPMLLTAVGLSTIIAGLFRHLNCHVDSCWRVNRHKIAGGEYGVCGKHWRQINGHPDDHKFTVAHLKERHLKATGGK